MTGKHWSPTMIGRADADALREAVRGGHTDRCAVGQALNGAGASCVCPPAPAVEIEPVAAGSGAVR